MTENSILYIRKGSQTIIGNLNLQLGSLLEVSVIAPYHGFILRENFKCSRPEENAGHALLLKCHEICEQLQNHRSQVKPDFNKLLENLNKLNNNNNPHNYIRNRNELMKVFMKKFFPGHVPEMPGYETLRDAIFSFLANYFLRNGNAAEFNLLSGIKTNAVPPQFQELPGLLQKYLEKSEAQRMELAALQILSGESGKYDWFLQQEFLTLNQKTEDAD